MSFRQTVIHFAAWGIVGAALYSGGIRFPSGEWWLVQLGMVIAMLNSIPED